MLKPPRRCVNEVSAETSQLKDLVLVSRRGLIAVVFDASSSMEDRIPGEQRKNTALMIEELKFRPVFR